MRRQRPPHPSLQFHLGQPESNRGACVVKSHQVGIETNFAHIRPRRPNAMRTYPDWNDLSSRFDELPPQYENHFNGHSDGELQAREAREA